MQRRADAIIRAAREVIEGKLDDHFPLVVWQTGSGTQTNMNLNEVIANRANEMLGGELGAKEAGSSQRPRQHEPVVERLVPDRDAHRRRQPHHRRSAPRARANCTAALRKKEKAFAKIVKIGRTHTQDATPLTLGQEFSGYAAQVESGIARLTIAVKELLSAGAGRHRRRHRPQLETAICQAVRQARREHHEAALHQRAQQIRGAGFQRRLCAWCTARSIRWRPACSRSPTTSACWAPGPRSGLGELILPENEPGSSIMPGKVNPTQCEAMTMVCCQVFGNQTAITVAGSQGHFELNVYKPVLAYCMMHSIQLMSDAARSFTEHCVGGIRADEKRIRELMERSLMLVTALAPKIGYDNAAKVAKTAHARGTTLKEEARAPRICKRR